MRVRDWRTLDIQTRAGAVGGVAVVALYLLAYVASFPETLADTTDLVAAPVGVLVAVVVPTAWPQPVVLLAPGIVGGAGAAAWVRRAGRRPGWRTRAALGASSWVVFTATAIIAPAVLVLLGPPLRSGELGVALLLELVLVTVVVTALVTVVLCGAAASILVVRYTMPPRRRA